MRRIRIGNDIILRIRLTRRGGAENLEGKKIGLMLRNILGSVSLPVVQSGEELIAGWQGTQQQWTGAYTVTLTEDWGENNRNTVDEACAFELVSISSDEGVETGTVNIELDMDISVPGNGLSAYEIAVLHGYEGSEEEWAALITGGGHEVIDMQDTDALKKKILVKGHPVWLRGNDHMIGIALKSDDLSYPATVEECLKEDYALYLPRLGYNKDESYGDNIIFGDVLGTDYRCDISDISVISGVHRLYGQIDPREHLFIDFLDQDAIDRYNHYTISFCRGMIGWNGDQAQYIKNRVSLSLGNDNPGYIPEWSKTFAYKGKTDDDILLGGGGTMSVRDLNDRHVLPLLWISKTLSHEIAHGENAGDDFDGICAEFTGTSIGYDFYAYKSETGKLYSEWNRTRFWESSDAYKDAGWHNRLFYSVQDKMAYWCTEGYDDGLGISRGFYPATDLSGYYTKKEIDGMLGHPASSSSGNMILDWKTDVATTRKQVTQDERKAGMMISYKNASGEWINEQYVGTEISDTSWGNDKNWLRMLDEDDKKSLTDKIGLLENKNVFLTQEEYEAIEAPDDDKLYFIYEE